MFPSKRLSRKLGDREYRVTQQVNQFNFAISREKDQADAETWLTRWSRIGCSTARPKGKANPRVQHPCTRDHRRMATPASGRRPPQLEKPLQTTTTCLHDEFDLRSSTWRVKRGAGRPPEITLQKKPYGFCALAEYCAPRGNRLKYFSAKRSRASARGKKR